MLFRLADLMIPCLPCVTLQGWVRAPASTFPTFVNRSIGQEVQLKILQTLPALLHNYSDVLSGELLARLLEVCATLQASKVAAVSNTAAATLQQLVSSAFEKVLAEDGEKPKECGNFIKQKLDAH